MLLTKFVKLTINPNNYKYLLSIGYKDLVMFDKITIPIEKLPEGSGYLVDVACDVCGENKKLSYRRYLKSFNNGGYYCCSNKCNIDKRKHSWRDEEREKRKNTMLDKYGVENASQSDEIKEKIKETCLEKYGVDNVFQSVEIKESIKETCLEKYGCENPSQSEEIKRKKEETCLKNNGVKYPTQNIDIFIKNKMSGLKVKKYKNLTYQGSYEKHFLDKYYNKYKIENGITIKYKHLSKNKYYHSDFFIEEYDLVIEIKSTYWYNKMLDMNLSKIEETKNHHNFILILDKNYDDFEKFIENYTSISL